MRLTHTLSQVQKISDSCQADLPRTICPERSSIRSDFLPVRSRSVHRYHWDGAVNILFRTFSLGHPLVHAHKVVLLNGSAPK
jgi:hypothetical protein